MIAVLTLIYLAVLFLAVKLKLIRLTMFWKLSPIVWFLFLNIALIIPMQFYAPGGAVIVGQYSVQVVPNVGGQVQAGLDNARFNLEQTVDCHSDGRNEYRPERCADTDDPSCHGAHGCDHQVVVVNVMYDFPNKHHCSLVSERRALDGARSYRMTLPRSNRPFQAVIPGMIIFR